MDEQLIPRMYVYLAASKPDFHPASGPAPQRDVMMQIISHFTFPNKHFSHAWIA